MNPFGIPRLEYQGQLSTTAAAVVTAQGIGLEIVRIHIHNNTSDSRSFTIFYDDLGTQSFDAATAIMSDDLDPASGPSYFEWTPQHPSGGIVLSKTGRLGMSANSTQLYATVWAVSGQAVAQRR